VRVIAANSRVRRVRTTFTPINLFEVRLRQAIGLSSIFEMDTRPRCSS
jgi:hypothetical protein